MKVRGWKLYALTVVVSLIAAAVLWVVLSRYPTSGFRRGGTIVVAAAQIQQGNDVFTMPAEAAKPLSDLLPSDWKKLKRRILVEKSKRILTVYVGSKRIKPYFMSLGFKPVGPKERRDDYKTPEGTYYVCSRNPKSAFELSVRISYPGAREAENGFKNGLVDKKTRDRILKALKRGGIPPQDTALGSDICIHGGGIGEVADDLSKAKIVDWTWGCMALRSEDIREVFDFAVPGTTIEIKP